MKTAKLIVIDDQQMEHFILQRMMEFYLSPIPSVQYYNDATKALNFLTENCSNPDFLPDLIFLDLNMPVMSGARFLEEFKKLRGLLLKDINIYIISSSIDPSDIELKTKFDFVSGYFIKPITEANMRAIFENFC